MSVYNHRERLFHLHAAYTAVDELYQSMLRMRDAGLCTQREADRGLVIARQMADFLITLTDYINRDILDEKSTPTSG